MLLILFQHTAARRRLGFELVGLPFPLACFNTQPPEGGWAKRLQDVRTWVSFNTQPPEGGWEDIEKAAARVKVSTHSRPKAAGRKLGKFDRNKLCFNTQPPEGGWLKGNLVFQADSAVSTHSRPKAAGCKYAHAKSITKSFQHTAARRRLDSEI